MRPMRWICALVLATVTLASAAFAFRPEGQVVNYADFRYVNYIATSVAKAYFATTNGIIVYNKLENRWEDPLTGYDGLVDNDVKRIWVDQFDQQLYAETITGRFNFDFTFHRWLQVNEIPDVGSEDKHVSPPTSMFPPFGYNYGSRGILIDPEARSFAMSDVVDDGHGNLWLGTWGNGAGRASVGANVIELLPYGLLQGPAYALQFDVDSSLVIAGPALSSPRTGISLFDQSNNGFSYIETGISPDLPTVDVSCLENDSTLFYIGTSHGIYLIERRNHEVTNRLDRRHGFSDENIVSLKREGDSLFAGTTSGLLLVSHRGDSVAYIGQRQFFNQTIFGLDVVADHLWVASSNGAYRVSLADGKLQQYKDPDAVLFSRVLNVAHFGKFLWLASDAGLVQINLETGSTSPYLIHTNRLDSRALAVNDRIAAVASDGGVTLIFYDRENPIIREFTVSDGLLSSYVYSLTLDGDYLWIGTDRGLTRFWWNNPHRID
jgi:ligand-binding sensor domain-containing protein